MVVDCTHDGEAITAIYKDEQAAILRCAQENAMIGGGGSWREFDIREHELIGKPA